MVLHVIDKCDNIENIKDMPVSEWNKGKFLDALHGLYFIALRANQNEIDSLRKLSVECTPDTTLGDIDSKYPTQLFMSEMLKIGASMFWNVAPQHFTKLIVGNKPKGIKGLTMDTTLGDISRQMDNSEYLLSNLIRASASLIVCLREHILKRDLAGRDEAKEFMIHLGLW